MASGFSTIGVVGLGTMGAGIAEVFARSGFAVIGIEPTEDALERGRGHLSRSTGRAVQRGRLSAEDEQAITGRVTFTTAMADAADCDLVIEAVPELLHLKRTIFKQLDEVCKPETILATNTSSLSVTEIAVTTGRPERVIGMHFFNPAPVMKLVEVVRTVVTEQAVVEDVVALARQLGKTDVAVTDRAGFVANALLFGYLNQAVTMLEHGVASAEDIDAAMRLGCGLPMGPFALLDLIGIDTSAEVLDTIYRQTGNRRYAAAPMIRQLVTAGLVGRKSGRGFYPYGVVPPAEPGDEAQGEAPGSVRAVNELVVVGSGTDASAVEAAAREAGIQVHVIELDEGGKPVDPGAPAALGSCDVVVDATPDDAEVKQAVFAVLDGHVPAGALLVTTASAVPVVACAMTTSRPEDVVGLRVRGSGERVVETVTTVRTSAESSARLAALAAQLGSHVVPLPDRAGGLVDALHVPYLNDAVAMVEQHYASVDDVDAAMTLGCGYPVGPIAALDDLGLDVALGVLQAMYAESGEPGLVPSPLLRHLVAAGQLGRRTGRGFREHDESAEA